MEFVSVPRGVSIKQFGSAPRVLVPALARFGGLAVTPSLTHAALFTVTHVRTGCAVPLLSELEWESANAIVGVLGDAFDWGAVSNPFFFKALSPTHQEALRGCIIALREMFGVE